MPSFAQQIERFRSKVPVIVNRPGVVVDKSSSAPFVASSLKPGEVLQAYLQTFDSDILNSYGISTLNLRSLMRFGSFYRTITLLAEALAGMLTARMLSVVTKDGDLVVNDRTRRALQIIRKRPSPGAPAITFWQDVAAEMLITGNALLRVLHAPGIQREITGFMLASSDNSHTELATRQNTPIAYRLGYIGHGESEVVAADDVVHCRFPVFSQSGSNKPGFAPAPVVAVVAATEVGRELDIRLKKWASDNRGNMHINLKSPPGMSQVKTPQDVVDKLRPILNSLDNRRPILTENSEIKVLEDRVMGEHTVTLLEHETEDILRVYGIPAPIGGIQLTSWGSGIEALIRLFYKSALKPNFERITGPLADVLLPQSQEFLPDAVDVVRGDAKSIQIMIQSLSGNQNGPPYGTVNEIRHLASMSNATPELEAEREAWNARSAASLENDPDDDSDNGDDDENSGDEE